jgi:hypothetical protein
LSLVTETGGVVVEGECGSGGQFDVFAADEFTGTDFRTFGVQENSDSAGVFARVDVLADVGDGLGVVLKKEKKEKGNGCGEILRIV